MSGNNAEAGKLAKVLDGQRAPVDRVARRVASGGVSFESRKVIQTADQHHPIEVRPFQDVDLALRSLIGLRFGRMTVVGLSYRPNRWAVRCDCGTYTLRTARAIRNPNNDFDCCEECRHLLFLKRRDVWKRTGRDFDWHGRPMPKDQA
jgi:hypothetical protein